MKYILIAVLFIACSHKQPKAVEVLADSAPTLRTFEAVETESPVNTNIVQVSQPKSDSDEDHERWGMPVYILDTLLYRHSALERTGGKHVFPKGAYLDEFTPLGYVNDIGKEVIKIEYAESFEQTMPYQNLGFLSLASTNGNTGKTSPIKWGDENFNDSPVLFLSCPYPYQVTYYTLYP